MIMIKWKPIQQEFYFPLCNSHNAFFIGHLQINLNILSNIYHLNNYFDFHVCLSFRRLRHPSVRASVRKLAPIPAEVSQNVTN